MMQIGNIFQAVMQQAQQLAGRFTDPQQMVQQFFPNAPQDVRGNPEQLMNWLQQSGRCTQQQIQMAQQMQKMFGK